MNKLKCTDCIIKWMIHERNTTAFEICCDLKRPWPLLLRLCFLLRSLDHNTQNCTVRCQTSWWKRGWFVMSPTKPQIHSTRTANAADPNPGVVINSFLWWFCQTTSSSSYNDAIISAAWKRILVFNGNELQSKSDQYSFQDKPCQYEQWICLFYNTVEAECSLSLRVLIEDKEEIKNCESQMSIYISRENWLLWSSMVR